MVGECADKLVIGKPLVFEAAAGRPFHQLPTFLGFADAFSVAVREFGH